jgi:hypothetical protein
MSAATELQAVSRLAVKVEPRPTTGTHPEFDLLAACCAATWDPAASSRVRQLLSSPLNWEKLPALAEHHGLVPLLFQSAAGLSRLIPPQPFAALRLRCQQNACRALWFTQELGRILGRMQSAGIEVLAHKGPALASLLYGDVAQRQFHDLDLLVRPQDLNQAKATLVGLGYQCAAEFNAAEERALLQSGYEQVFHSPRGKNLLELQWRILPRFYAVDFDMEKLFARSKEVQLADRSCRMLSPEDLLLALCVHAAKHGWTQLSWLRDITQLAGMSGLDWEYIAKEADRMGIRRMLAINFALCSRLFGAIALALIPSPLISWMGEEQAGALAEEILTALRNSAVRETESLAYFRWTMQLREHRRDRARLLWRLASTPSIGEWQTVKLPAPLFSLYRMVRVYRLAKRLF